MVDIAWVKQNTTDSDRNTSVFLAETVTDTNSATESIRCTGELTILTVQMAGTFASATATVQGSLDGGTTWFTVEDLQGDAAALTADGAVFLSTQPKLLRVNTAGGTGTQDIDIYLQMTRNLS